MSDMSPFGVDHTIISKRGGKLARLFGRGAKKPSQPQLLPNGKTIEQMRNAPGPTGPRGETFEQMMMSSRSKLSGPTGPKPRSASKPASSPKPRPKFEPMKIPDAKPAPKSRGLYTPKPFDSPNGGVRRRKFRSNDITRTDGPLG